jgi:hypothetical protein
MFLPPPPPLSPLIHLREIQILESTVPSINPSIALAYGLNWKHAIFRLELLLILLPPTTTAAADTKQPLTALHAHNTGCGSAACKQFTKEQRADSSSI